MLIFVSFNYVNYLIIGDWYHKHISISNLIDLKTDLIKIHRFFSNVSLYFNYLTLNSFNAFKRFSSNLNRFRQIRHLNLIIKLLTPLKYLKALEENYNILRLILEYYSKIKHECYNN